LKKAFAIFFLVIFLFNVGGYYLLFWGLKSQAKSDLLHRLDADQYVSEETIILSIPLSLPYPIHEANYERAQGEFEYRGESYHLVKQKIENDTLFAVCIKDQRQKKLDHAMNEYANLTNNLPASTKNTLDLLGKLFKDYTPSAFSLQATLLTWSREIPFIEKSFTIQHRGFAVDSPPPELIEEFS
jgi:hypothetical protein